MLTCFQTCQFPSGAAFTHLCLQLWKECCSWNHKWRSTVCTTLGRRAQGWDPFEKSSSDSDCICSTLRGTKRSLTSLSCPGSQTKLSSNCSLMLPTPRRTCAPRYVLFWEAEYNWGTLLITNSQFLLKQLQQIYTAVSALPRPSFKALKLLQSLRSLQPL